MFRVIKNSLLGVVTDTTRSSLFRREVFKGGTAITVTNDSSTNESLAG